MSGHNVQMCTRTGFLSMLLSSSSGKQASHAQLAEGHSQLKSAVSDLLARLNASNAGV